MRALFHFGHMHRPRCALRTRNISVETTALAEELLSRQVRELIVSKGVTELSSIVLHNLDVVLEPLFERGGLLLLCRVRLRSKAWVA